MSMPAQKIRPVREQYEKMTDSLYKKRLQQRLKPQKEVLMEKKLAKFRRYREQQEKNVQLQKREMELQEKEIKEQKRRAELNKLQRNAGFMDEWQEKGLNDWSANMEKMHKREKEDEKFKLKQNEMTLAALTKIKQASKHETYHEINEFEKRMQSFKKRPGEMKQEDDSGDEDLAQTASARPAKPLVQRDSKYKQLQYNKEREQRRRKILMEQNKMHREFDAKRREDDIVERMNRLSRQEQELEYEVWRTGQCKTIIEENRKLREARYHKREDLDTEVIMIREEEALTALRNQLTNSEAIEKERADSYIVARNQYKHNDNSSSCQEFLDLIFDLADEAFKHQQLSDSPNFDQRNWREWTQLFVDKLPMIANSPMTYSQVEEEGRLETANVRIDYLELLDYLGSRHQWERSGEEKFVNNFELGNIVRKLITWSFPMPPKHDRPQLALDVKLKLSIVGYAFAGKKTQAKMLCDRHGIAFISIEELLKEALEECSAENEQEGTKKPEKEKDPELEGLGSEIKAGMLKGEEVTDEMYVKLITCKLNKLFGFHTKADYYSKVREVKVKEIEDQEPQGEENQQESPEDKPSEQPPNEEPSQKVEDTEQVAEDQKEEQSPQEDEKELPQEELKDNEEENKSQEQAEDEDKPHDQIEDEDKLQEQVEDKAEEAKEPQEPSPEDKKEEIFIPGEEVGALLEEEAEGQKVKGFILVDFPSTLHQAKLLEEALTGYVCDEDKETEAKDQLLAEASVLAVPTPLPPAPQELVPSGLDAVVWLKAPKTECIRRSFGLQKDLKNNFLYHVLYNPPPITESDVVEKLQPETDSELLNAMLTDRHIAFDMARSALLKWLKRFGDEKRGRCLLQEVETPELNNKEQGLKEAAVENIKLVNKKICEIVDKVLQGNNEEDDAHSMRVKAELEHSRKVKELTLEFERQSMTYEDEVVKYIMRQEEKKAREEEAERLAKEQKKGARGDPKGKKEAKKEAKKDAKLEESVQEEVKEEEKVPEPPVFPDIKPLDSEIIEAEPEVQIEDQFKCKLVINEIAVLLEFWKVASNLYTTAVKKNMRLIRKQREFIVKDANTFQNDMLTLLEKPQPRQKLIDEYIQIYNQFLDDNVDMIEDGETKMEMHQRVEDLCAKLVELVEELQKASLARREAIMKSGWAEYQLESLLSYSQSLMQSEVTRYRSFSRFAEDFYAARDGRPMAETGEESLFEPIVDGASLPGVEYEGEECPRLEFLYQSAMGVVTGEMPVVAKDAKGKKEAKKEIKKISKKDAGKKKEEEPPAEENKELTALLEAEKSILKYRLGTIREWSERRVREVRGTCKSLYDRLVDWIRVTIKCQREAINQLSMRLREAIEEERKIQKEIRMKSFDLIMDEKFLYFIVPPPELLPAIEAVIDSRFSIVQLHNLLLNLKLITEPNGMLDLGLLIALLSKKSVNSGITSIEAREAFREGRGTAQELERLLVRDLPADGGEFGQRQDRLREVHGRGQLFCPAGVHVAERERTGGVRHKAVGCVPGRVGGKGGVCEGGGVVRLLRRVRAEGTGGEIRQSGNDQRTAVRHQQKLRNGSLPT